MANYATFTEGNDYVLTNKLAIDRAPWDDADEGDKTVALTMATAAIDQLNYAGCKADSTQVNQFPRVAEGTTVSEIEAPVADTTFPLAIKEASIEIAIAFLDEVRIDIEIDNLKVSGFSYSDARGTYTGAGVSAHYAAGIPSNTAWRMILPFLRDTRGIKLSRV